MQDAHSQMPTGDIPMLEILSDCNSALSKPKEKIKIRERSIPFSDALDFFKNLESDSKGSSSIPERRTDLPKTPEELARRRERQYRYSALSTNPFIIRDNARRIAEKFNIQALENMDTQDNPNARVVPEVKQSSLDVLFEGGLVDFIEVAEYYDMPSVDVYNAEFPIPFSIPILRYKEAFSELTKEKKQLNVPKRLSKEDPKDEAGHPQQC